MSCRSAILIDNFLEQEKFYAISTQVAASASYNGSRVADLMDGLTVAASMGSINPSDTNNDSDEVTLSASYAVGGVTIGYTPVYIIHYTLIG